MYGFIYITTNHINEKQYIGQKKYGVNGWETYLGSGIALNNAIKKYGKENFTREIIDEADSPEKLNEKEIYWIKYYNATKSKNFYNIASGGEGGNTIIGYSKEEKEKLSQKRSESLKGINLGKLNGSSKPVICLNTMEIFDCGADADRYYGFKSDTVSNVCNPNSDSKTTKNPNGKERLVWEYYYPEKEYHYVPFVPDHTTKHRRKVYCFEHNKIYNSILECANALNTTPNILHYTLTHKNHAYKKVHLMYYDEYINSSEDDLYQIRLDSRPKAWKRNGFYHKHHSKESKQKMSENSAKTWKGKFGNQHNKSKNVLCVDTGKVFGSTREVEREMRIDHSSVGKCCNGKQKTAGGYHWTYV